MLIDCNKVSPEPSVLQAELCSSPSPSPERRGSSPWSRSVASCAPASAPPNVSCSEGSGTGESSARGVSPVWGRGAEFSPHLPHVLLGMRALPVPVQSCFPSQNSWSVPFLVCTGTRGCPQPDVGQDFRAWAGQCPSLLATLTVHAHALCSCFWWCH